MIILEKIVKIDAIFKNLILQMEINCHQQLYFMKIFLVDII